MSKKGIVVFIMFVWCSLLWAMKEDDITSWEIVSEDQSFYLKLKNESKKMVEIEGRGQSPVLEKIECEKKSGLCLVVFYIGESGTSRIVKQWNAVVYNSKTGFFEGEFPYKYEDGNHYYPQPKFQFLKNKLQISDESSGTQKEIFFK